MLQIVITGVKSNGELELEVNGRPNNGNSPAEKGWIVNWRVNPNIGIDYIDDIKWKDISGSTDIFSSTPPRAQDAQRRHWKGRINRNAEDYSVYVYSIDWVRVGSTEVNTFDPLMPIKPSTHFAKVLFNSVATVVTVAAIAVVASFCISQLSSHKKKIGW